MPHRTDLQTLPLPDIASRCARETRLFFEGQDHDLGHCFELFRRAIVDGNQRAWDRVYEQYRPLVTGWVKRHSAFPTSGEEAQYFVNRTFEKMWGAMTPTKFRRFPNLKPLLRYMQTCVHSVIIDQVRVAEQPTWDVQIETLTNEHGDKDMAVENLALDRVHRQEFWKEIRTRLRDEKECCVVYGSFILALKPREIYAQFPETFYDVADVYRVKENVLARLRRDAKLKKLLKDDA